MAISVMRQASCSVSGAGDSPRSERANCVKMSAGFFSGSVRGRRSAVTSVTLCSISAVSMTPRDPAIRSRSSPCVGAGSGRR